MNTNTVNAKIAIEVLEAVAPAGAVRVDTAADPSAVATRCFAVASRLADASVFDVVTYERPCWSCSKKRRATAIRSSKN
jgi:hypothetical protein